MLRIVAVVAVFASLSECQSLAQGELLTFDDLPIHGNPPIPDSYGGLQWSGFWYLDGTHFRAPSGYTIGYNYGVVSPDNVAYGEAGDPTFITGALFNLNSGYFTAAWRDDLELQVQGFLGGTLVYNETYILQPTAPTLINFDFFGVDQVTFASLGSRVHYPLWGDGEMFVVDNLSITLIPEPSPKALGSILLLITSALRAVRKKRGLASS